MKAMKFYDVYTKKKVTLTNYTVSKDKRGRARAVGVSPSGRGKVYRYI